MRNLLEHPITTDETIAELEAVKAEWLVQEGAEFRYGAMRPLLLDAAIAAVKEMPVVQRELTGMLATIRQLIELLAEIDKHCKSPEPN